MENVGEPGGASATDGGQAAGGNADAERRAECARTNVSDAVGA